MPITRSFAHRRPAEYRIRRLGRSCCQQPAPSDATAQRSPSQPYKRLRPQVGAWHGAARNASRCAKENWLRGDICRRLRTLTLRPRAVAQSKERRPCTAEIRGSSPLGSARSMTRPKQRFTVVNCRGARSTCCSAPFGTRNLPNDRRGHPGLANSRACLSEAVHDPLLHFMETSEEKPPSLLTKVRPIQRQRIPPQSLRSNVSS